MSENGDGCFSQADNIAPDIRPLVVRGPGYENAETSMR